MFPPCWHAQGMSVVLVVVLVIVLDDSHFVSIELEGNGLPCLESHMVALIDACINLCVGACDHSMAIVAFSGCVPYLIAIVA